MRDWALVYTVIKSNRSVLRSVALCDSSRKTDEDSRCALRRTSPYPDKRSTYQTESLSDSLESRESTCPRVTHLAQNLSTSRFIYHKKMACILVAKSPRFIPVLHMWTLGNTFLFYSVSDNLTNLISS